MAPRLSQVDALIREDHSFLDSSDECFFLYEYTARRGYAFSAGNNLIINLKKSPDRRGTPEWRWKLRAIQQAAHELRGRGIRLQRKMAEEHYSCAGSALEGKGASAS